MIDMSNTRQLVGYEKVKPRVVLEATHQSNRKLDIAQQILPCTSMWLDIFPDIFTKEEQKGVNTNT